MALKTFEHVLILADDVDKTKGLLCRYLRFKCWLQT